MKNAYRGKTVLVTGHTGFKGAWLSEWLLMLGARVVGVALPPNTQPALFEQLKLADRLEHHILDIRDGDALAQRVRATEPDFVFHLAAQPLVRQSYVEPVETYATNVMGTVNLLEALRELDAPYRADERCCACVFITTDKCYENREWVHGYREEDPLGGYDPYSSSKAAAELAIAAYRRSFFNPLNPERRPAIGIASARAGNVIGGGDWAKDRIVPDCIRSLGESEPILVRNPLATRPWQHVLEPLGGYLLLALRQQSALNRQEINEIAAMCTAYNFGPSLHSNRSVHELVDELISHWPGRWENGSAPLSEHEASKLNLTWDKAYHQLDWAPCWDFQESIRRTVTWYRQNLDERVDAAVLTHRDIAAYIAQLRTPVTNKRA